MGALAVTINNVNNLPEETFEELCEKVYDEIVSATPVDTGTCQSGWSIEMNGNSCKIVNPVPYTSYLEDGHSSQAPHGMVQEALDNTPELKSHIRTYDIDDNSLSQKDWVKLRNAQIRARRNK